MKPRYLYLIWLLSQPILVAGSKLITFTLLRDIFEQSRASPRLHFYIAAQPARILPFRANSFPHTDRLFTPKKTRDRLQTKIHNCNTILRNMSNSPCALPPLFQSSCTIHSPRILPSRLNFPSQILFRFKENLRTTISKIQKRNLTICFKIMHTN